MWRVQIRVWVFLREETDVVMKAGTIVGWSSQIWLLHTMNCSELAVMATLHWELEMQEGTETAPFASAGSLEACNRESQAHAWPLGWVPPGRRCHRMRHAPQVSSLSAGAVWPQFSRGPWGLGPFSACNQWGLSTPGDQGQGNIIIILVNIWAFTYV